MSSAAQGIQEKSEFKHLLSTDAPETLFRLKNLIDNNEKRKERLKKRRVEISSTLTNMRFNFNRILDRLEKYSTTEMDRQLLLLEKDLSSVKLTGTNLHNKIEIILNEIRNLGRECDDQAFLGYKECLRHIAEAENLMTKAGCNLHFTPNAEIGRYLSSLKCLGKFHMKSSSVKVSTKPSLKVKAS